MGSTLRLHLFPTARSHLFCGEYVLCIRDRQVLHFSNMQAFRLVKNSIINVELPGVDVEEEAFEDMEEVERAVSWHSGLFPYQFRVLSSCQV